VQRQERDGLHPVRQPPGPASGTGHTRGRRGGRLKDRANGWNSLRAAKPGQSGNSRRAVGMSSYSIMVYAGKQRDEQFVKQTRTRQRRLR
jgi:hypothetical protein